MGSIYRSSFGVALGLVLALTGCSTPASLPFQPRRAGLAAYGYSEAKIDATHFSVSYSDNNAKGADNFLELRAAQIAQGAGFQNFAFDDRGTSVVRHTENDINYNDVARQGMPGGGGRHTLDMLPQSVPIATDKYYYAWGKIVLLTDNQARDNAKALHVSDVLARSAAAATQ